VVGDGDPPGACRPVHLAWSRCALLSRVGVSSSVAQVMTDRASLFLPLARKIVEGPGDELAAGAGVRTLAEESITRRP
jgi:hypothetical protein